MSIIKNISFFLAAVIFAKGIGFMQSFVLARSLDPSGFGVWVTLLLIVSYSPIVCLGTLETMVKEVPFYLGRNEISRVRAIEKGVFGSVILSALVLLLIGSVSFVFGSPISGIDSSLLFLVFLAIAISTCTSFFYWRFTAYENFKAVASLDAARSVVSFCCIATLAWLWGLRAALTGYVLQEAVMCIATVLPNVRAHGWAGVSFRRDLLWHAVRVGFPITILWWVLTLQATLDRVVLGSMLGPAAVGYFGLGISIVGGLALVPMAVGRVLYPRVNSQFGQQPNAESMKSLVLAPTLALGTLLANMQVVLLVMAPLLYCRLLPKYEPGLIAGQVLLLGSFFSCLLRNGANYLIATHQEKIFLKYIFATLAFNAIADICLVKIGWNIEGVALGTALAGFLLGTLVWRRVLIGLGFAGNVWQKIFELYLPFFMLILACGVLWLTSSSVFHQWNGACVLTGIGLLMFVNLALCCFPTYREEMLSWKDRLLILLRSLATGAVRIASSLVKP